MSFGEWVGSLLGMSAYQPDHLIEGPPKSVQRAGRRVMGGQLAQLPITQTRWLLQDLERAQSAANSGELSAAGRLWRSCKTDGVLMGVLSTRTGGLVALPKRFRGRRDIVEALEYGHDSVRSVFDMMFPPAELSALASDGLGLGVGIAELVDVPGRDFPVMVRLDPEWLLYRQVDGCWYYRSTVGLIPIVPGDGRWILHVPGGRVAPWNAGIWRAVGRAYINKEHALLYDANWQGKLANPARVAVAPQGTTEAQRQTFWRRVMAWSTNTVFGLPSGWDVKLLESNGRGHESFDRAVSRSEREMIIAVAGQMVTTDGGAGFQNSDIHKSIRADLIKQSADDLAFTINTQGIPQFVLRRFGPEALYESACVEWDVTPPRDRKADADAQQMVGQAVKLLTDALVPYGRQLDIDEFMARYGTPITVADPEVSARVLPEVSPSAEPAEDKANG